MKLPHYTSKDYVVLAWVLLPFDVSLNSFIFGTLYYTNWQIFVLATLITGVACVLDFILCGFVAVTCKKRFPLESQLGMRLSVMILMFLVITGLFLYSLFRGYEAVGFYDYTFNEKRFVWCYMAMGILNMFLTFLHEGIARYESWNANLKETEELRKAYKQSQLMGLKSQVTPHFLFNSLNTLSSLISEDEESAEKFLNEMSKVYRYMLRNDDDQLVTLQTELSFIDSYIYLLKARYSQALQLHTDVDEEDRQKYLPPLTLQVIIENAVSQNAFSKSAPLTISICSEGNGDLAIRNNVQQKIVTEVMDYESGLDNLVNKYRLLNQTSLAIEETTHERIIRLPLITKNEKVAL
ncbi:MAG TPA: histidine kinase [Flavitalea sp.]|nr:histidine kinase [Flavitalea sp.]